MNFITVRNANAAQRFGEACCKQLFEQLACSSALGKTISRSILLNHCCESLHYIDREIVLSLKATEIERYLAFSCELPPDMIEDPCCQVCGLVHRAHFPKQCTAQCARCGLDRPLHRPLMAHRDATSSYRVKVCHACRTFQCMSCSGIVGIKDWSWDRSSMHIADVDVGKKCRLHRFNCSACKLDKAASEFQKKLLENNKARGSTLICAGCRCMGHTARNWHAYQCKFCGCEQKQIENFTRRGGILNCLACVGLRKWHSLKKRFAGKAVKGAAKHRDQRH